MCGITGIIDFSGEIPDRALLTAMNNTIARRGPDADGIALNNYMGFAHRRLSIIDLSPSGAQPMSNESKTRWIVFNGEIYNYKELKSDLILNGVEFKTSSDTEVILEGTKFWGFETFLSKARGMWAFAIWDKEKKQLTLCRDRLGKKPLFYTIFENKLYFSSSINALKIIGLPLVLNDDAVASYLAFGYIPASQCIYNNIHKLEAGSFIQFNNESVGIKEKYWELYSNPNNIKPEEAQEQIDFLLNESVKDRLVADVEVGSFLSGGIDSAMVTTKMAALQSNTRTFTMKVSGWRNEADRAQIIVDQIKSNHQLIEVSSEEVKILPELIAAYGEPFADSSMIPTALVSREAAKQVKVVLTGDGGDESFGAYKEPHQFLAFKKNSNNKQLAIIFQKIMNARPYLFVDKGRTIEKQLSVSADGLLGFLNLSKNIDPVTASIILGDKIKKKYLQMNLMEKYLTETPEMPEWRKLMHVQFRHRMQSSYLVKVDVASMHFGLETRAPLLDHRLIEYAFSLPFETWNYSGLTKGIFSNLATNYLPKKFLQFPKHGFSIPVEEYITNQWKPIFLSYIKNGIAEELGYIKSSGIIKVMEHYGKNIPFRISSIFFTIFCLEIWLKQEKNEFNHDLFLNNLNDKKN